MNKTTVYESSITNVSNNQRAFRALIGMAAITAVIIGAVASPAAIFALTTTTVYLGMTAIMGLDPFYFLVEKLMKIDEWLHWFPARNHS